MLKRTCPLVLQACESLSVKGLQNRIDVGAGQP